jgi:hypothetical protein
MKKEKFEFRECDACAALPGSPVLCSGCIHNRTTIFRLIENESKRKQEMIEELANTVSYYPSRMRMSMPNEKFPVAFFQCDIPDGLVWKIYEMGVNDSCRIIRSFNTKK